MHRAEKKKRNKKQRPYPMNKRLARARAPPVVTTHILQKRLSKTTPSRR
jgi:hypothetical protein